MPDQAGKLRKGAECAQITDLLDLSAWPEGSRVICRREDRIRCAKDTGLANPAPNLAATSERMPTSSNRT